MATIAERAKVYYPTDYLDDKVGRQIYIHIATEQKQIDEADFEKWLRDFLNDREKKGEFDFNKTLISDIIFSFMDFIRNR